MTRVILDCDPGHDDAVAILLALGNPAIDLVALTTVAGNQTLARTTENARRVLALAGRTDVLVADGADRPLVRELVVAPDIHGASGIDGAELPEPVVPADPRGAVRLIVRRADARDRAGRDRSADQRRGGARQRRAAARDRLDGRRDRARQRHAGGRVQRLRRPRGRGRRAGERHPR